MPSDKAATKTKKKRDDPSEQEDNDEANAKKRPRNAPPRILEEIPTSAHYQVSFMHRAVVSHVTTSLKHGYIITACRDGIVKFWKRTATNPDDVAAAAPKFKQAKDETPSTPCLEFVKSFTAHVGPVAALCIDSANDTVASIGKDDGFIKLYDVSTFDATAMVKTSLTSSMGAAACFLCDASKDLLLGLSDSSNGKIYIYSIATLSLIQTLTLHSKPVTAMAYNSKHNCCVSADEQGVLEVWDCTSGSNSQHSKEGEEAVVGATCSMARNQMEYASKLDTDLYALAKKNTHALCISMSTNYFVVYGADHKVRVYHLSTGKVAVRYDERLEMYEGKFSTYGMDSIEYGKRAATEREMMDHQQQQTMLGMSHLVEMDPSERYLLIVTMVGIKLIEWKKNKMVKIIGKSDASQLRFLSFSLCLGDAKTNQQMLLARSSGSSIAVEDKKKAQDAILVALSYQQRRFYVFSHVDPLQDQHEKESADKTIVARDIWNEPPSAQDRLLGSEGGHRSGGASHAAAFAKAILRTTMGDIHIKLFAEVPKTLENFCGHARSGYYDNVIFHRVIQVGIVVFFCVLYA
jgi:peptidylprolyl isomerase domain and WD repeat-containing protein 1